MSRLHVAILAAALAVASAAGTVGMLKTRALSAADSKPEVAAASAIRKREKALDRWEASLDKALLSRPPALPAVPRYAAAQVVGVAQGAALPQLATPAPTRARTQTAARPVKRTAAKPAVAARRTARRPKDDAIPTTPAAPRTPATQPTAPAAPATPVAAPAPTTPASAPPPHESSGGGTKQSAEQQCEALKQAAEGKGEAAKQAAEQQCEALKQAAER